MMQAQEDVYALLFGVRRSIRYHSRRIAWFQFWHRAGATLGALFATSALVGLMASFPRVGTLASAIVVFFLVIDLVVDHASKANHHRDFVRRFSALEMDMIRAGEATSEDDYKAFLARRLTIEAEEPPINRALDLQCHNELLRALDHDEQPVPIPWYRRSWLAHI